MEEVQLETISKELQLFDLTVATLEKMKTDYLPLVIEGIADKAGYKAVHSARMLVKSTRIKVEKNGGELRRKKRAEIEEYIQKVFKVEKFILGELGPIEDHLQSQEKAVDDEVARLKKEAEDAQAAKIKARVDYLESLGMSSAGGFYRLPWNPEGLAVPQLMVKDLTDEQWAEWGRTLRCEIQAETARKEVAEKAKKEEEARIAKVAAEQEAERLRLEGIAEEQAANEARIKAEASEREAKAKAEAEERQRKAEEEIAAKNAEVRAKLEAVEKREREIKEKQEREAAEKKRLEEIERAKIEAAAKAKAEAEEAARQAEKEATEREEAAKQVAIRAEKMRPDKEKMLLFASAIELVVVPEISTNEARQILTDCEMDIAKALRKMRKRVEAEL